MDKMQVNIATEPLTPLLVGRDGLVDFYLTLRVHRRVVWLAQRSMAGTGVVPLVACLLRYAVVLLNEFHLPLGLKQFQHQRNCCPHDATPDDERIDLRTHDLEGRVARRFLVMQQRSFVL
mgnify:CR=1 FL=1